jgi:exodeoxyribonuclease VII small subunit
MTKKHNFEEALSRLEELVNELESGEVQLDDMLKKYEEGAELIKFCLTRLDKAEKQIQLLSGNAEKGFTLDAFEE